MTYFKAYVTKQFCVFIFGIHFFKMTLFDSLSLLFIFILFIHRNMNPQTSNRKSLTGTFYYKINTFTFILWIPLPTLNFQIFKAGFSEKMK